MKAKRATAASARFAAAVLAGLAMLAGCASAPSERTLKVGGALHLPAATQQVKIAVVREPRGFHSNLPPSGSDVVGGTLQELERAGPDPRIIAAVPVAVAVTGAVATVFGLSSGTVETSAGAVAKATAGEEMTSRVASVVQGRLAEIFPGKVERVPAVPASLEPAKQPRRRLMNEPPPSEFAVQVRLMFWGFQTRLTALNDDMIKLAESANPPLALVIAVQVLALAAPDGDFSGGVSAVYESVPRRLEYWAADEARRLRDELAAAERELVGEILARIASP
ncbi:MAG: hypothetical protein JNL39_20880 [Opitutaceae bacterium]|nr:hypothetical protein [Opitutaceae bacterium]